MKSVVITFPGSNCDRDAITALQSLGSKVESIWHQETSLPDNADFIVIPGGFSYGDYLRSGAMASNSKIMSEVVKAANSGVHVLGICNGFQILTESGLLHGTLMRNQSTKFICKDVFLKSFNSNSAFTKGYAQYNAARIPIAHMDGRYFANDDMLKQLQDKDLIAFRYVDQDGNVSAEANPNGSIDNIAGVLNESGNVLGMMPHPERAVDSNTKSNDGKIMFESLIERFKT